MMRAVRILVLAGVACLGVAVLTRGVSGLVALPNTASIKFLDLASTVLGFASLVVGLIAWVKQDRGPN
jgi:hypothetical protein